MNREGWDVRCFGARPLSVLPDPGDSKFWIWEISVLIDKLVLNSLDVEVTFDAFL